jgi:hypothetical protein
MGAAADCLCTIVLCPEVMGWMGGVCGEFGVVGVGAGEKDVDIVWR